MDIYSISNMDEIDRLYFRHVMRLKRKGVPNLANLGERNGQWKGGRIFRDGYYLIKDWNHPRHQNNGYVLEHIVVLEEKLGRPLAKNEVSHHINGDKTDNRAENLEVMNRAHHISQHHTNAKFVDHSNTICSICKSTKTKMNFKRNKIDKYPLWLYRNGMPVCFNCYVRERRAIHL